MLGVTVFHEDDPLQAAIISAHCKVAIVGHGALRAR